MSELSSMPGVIPYIEAHDGPRRMLSLEAVPYGGIQEYVRPIVAIDGRPFQVFWGVANFEVPADRNVHVSAHIMGEMMQGFASMLIEPGFDHESLRYLLQGSRMGLLQRAGIPM